MSVTKTSAVMGSPLYMSPEQMQSAKSADAQSDIWALGVILYELLAGKVPFDGEAATEVAVKVSMEPPPALRGYRPEVPPGLEAVIFKCLEKDRKNRYRNVAELSLALAKFAPKRALGSIERITNTIQAAGLSVSALDMPPSPQVQGTMPAGTIAPVGQTTPGASAGSSRTGFVVGLALAAIIVVGGAGVVLVRTGGGTHGAGSAPTVSAALPPPAASESSASLAPLPTDSATAAPVVPVSAIPPAQPATVSTSRPPPHAAVAPQAVAVPPPATQGQRSSPDCAEKSFLGADGRTHFKPECLK